MMSGAQRNINKPDGPSCLIAIKIRVVCTVLVLGRTEKKEKEKRTVVQVSQDGGHDQRNTLSVCASSSLKIDSKSLAYCAISCVFQEYE